MDCVAKTRNVALTYTSVTKTLLSIGPILREAYQANLTSSGANLSWLQFNWLYAGSTNGAFTVDPCGQANFGIFRSNDRIIFEKEVFQ